MTQVLATAPHDIRSMTAPLFDLSLKGLERMFLADRGLFCHQLVQTDQGLQVSGVSHRYTLMTLLGLHRYERAHGRSRFQVRDLLARLATSTDWSEGVGDLGLLLWACAEIAPELLSEAIPQSGALSALRYAPEARDGATMELAWFLTGIASVMATQPSRKGDWESAGRHCVDLLKRNQGRSGFFGHVGARSSVTGLIRGRIGSFADQVYPMIALSRFGRATGDQEVLRSALACARAVCDSQGELGQWWWHYDAPTGRVLQHYPVYSVHQEGMGPMALFAVSEATGHDFTAHAMKGLEWIDGRNERREDLRSSDVGVVWRCIRFDGRASMLRNEAGLFRRGPLPRGVPLQGLTTLHECRPYELGWLLYAFGGSGE